MLERAVFAERRAPAQPELPEAPSEATPSDMRQGDEETPDVVLDDCAAVRGILHDDQGGPLHPPGLRMAAALEDVQGSLQRNLEAKKGGLRTNVSRA